MLFHKSLKQKLFRLSHNEFNELALNIFRYQSVNNIVYADYLSQLNITNSDIKELKQIPFLPISFFKTEVIKSGKWNSDHIFQSSGTTQSVNSMHHIRSLEYYKAHSLQLFENVYGSVKGYHIMALLPSYLERDNSSLVFMVDSLIKKSDSSLSGFYLNDLDQLIHDIEVAKKSKRKIMLIGVSFALLDLIEYKNVDLAGHIVMETGGMKGRRKEMVRAELHALLKQGFNVQNIHSEYGMTELLSQCYSLGKGIYATSPAMKVIIRDLYDPFTLVKETKTGGINIIDLANYDTCSFIETSDIGRKEGKLFEILGRYDNSETRGCNLMLS